MDWAGFSLRCSDIPHHLSYITNTDYAGDSTEPNGDDLEAESYVLMQSYRLKVRTVGSGVDTNDSSTSNPNMSAAATGGGGGGGAYKQVCSLQQWCRRAALKALTLHRIDKINDLPLPHALKQFIGTFSVPDDFNTDGFHMTYNFHFPNHPHHKTHRVHPARCLITDDLSNKVLIKVQNNDAQQCSVCATVGFNNMSQQSVPTNNVGLDYHQESDHWALVNHPHIQRCFMKMTNEPEQITNSSGVVDHHQGLQGGNNNQSRSASSSPSSGGGITCYVLEFPLINLKDVILRLSLCGSYIPEFLLWDTIFRIASALQYLDSQGLYSELCEPQNFVLMPDGQVKVENLLLYLPNAQGNNMSAYRTSLTRQKIAIYAAPELWLDQQYLMPVATEPMTVWALGCVFYELASLCPAFLLETYTIKVSLIPGTTLGPVWGPPTPPHSRISGLRLRPQTPPPLPAAYSHQLGNLIGSCLREFAEDRPSMAQIMQVAAFNVEHLSPSYFGPRSLLDLIPNVPMDD